MKNIILQSVKKSVLASLLILIVFLLLSSLEDGFHTRVINNILDYFSFFFTAFLIGFLISYRIKIIYLGILICACLTFVVNYSINEAFSNSLFSYKTTAKLVGAAAILTSVLTYLFSRNKTSSKKIKLSVVAYPFTNSIFFYFIILTLYAIIFVWAMGNPYKESLRFLYDILFIDSTVIFTITFFLFKFIYQYVKKRMIVIYGYYFIIFFYYLLICYFTYDSLHGAMNIQNFMSYLLLRVPYIFMIIASIQISYLIQYSKNEKKQLIQQSLESQLNYQQLKNQLSPHFLFNNINVLTSLIEESPLKAIRFSENLSHIYRYFLEQEKQDVVLVKTEIAFVKSYLALLKDRFEVGLNFSIIIDKESEEKHIVSTILQQVLENVVKHNAINETNFVEVKITSMDNYLVIENNKNAKIKTVQHSKKGIENIKMRVAFFTDQKVIIVNNETHYTIKLPILEIAE